MTNYKLRISSLLKALSNDGTMESPQLPKEHFNLFVVGSWSLTHQNLFENFSKTNQLNLSQIADSAKMLEVVQALVHLPYIPGVLVCQADESIDDALRLLKFFNASHPDGILKIVFMGSLQDVETALYLDQQSAGFKKITSKENEINNFLLNALHASSKQRGALLESLVSIAKLSSLTPKEMAVMVQVLNGFANKEIATRMGNSTRTIELHRASIFEKMDVKNAIDLSMLVHSAVRN